MNGKKLFWILLIGLVVVASVDAAVFIEPWAGLVVLLVGGLFGFSGKIFPCTVNAHYNPLVENGSQKVDANRKSHPEDIPLNPWDTITGNGEKTE